MVGATSASPSGESLEPAPDMPWKFSQSLQGFIALALVGVVVWNIVLTILVMQNGRSIFQEEGNRATLSEGRRMVILGSLEVQGNIFVRGTETGKGNIVVGQGHTYGNAKDSLIIGKANAVEGTGATVLGLENIAKSDFSLTAGYRNRALAEASLVLGGSQNVAQGKRSTITGGPGVTIDEVDGFFSPPNSETLPPSEAHERVTLRGSLLK